MKQKLNDFIKVIYMNKNSFKCLVSKVGESEIKDLLKSVENMYENQSKVYVNRLEELGIEPISDIGLVGKFSEKFYKIKNSFKGDIDLKEEGREVIKLGNKMANKFLKDNLEIDFKTKLIVEKMIKQNEKKLKEFLN